MTNVEFKNYLQNRTIAFSVTVIELLQKISITRISRNIKDQIIRSSTSIGANYHEANRAESRSDFIHKIAITAKEASETEYWLSILEKLFPEYKEIVACRSEVAELVRIFDKIHLTACKNKRLRA